MACIQDQALTVGDHALRKPEGPRHDVRKNAVPKDCHA
jgi:hypothetical protein